MAKIHPCDAKIDARRNPPVGAAIGQWWVTARGKHGGHVNVRGGRA